jgi:hypothetical protein
MAGGVLTLRSLRQKTAPAFGQVLAAWRGSGGTVGLMVLPGGSGLWPGMGTRTGG